MVGDIMEMILGLILNMLYFLLGITVGLAIIVIVSAIYLGIKDKWG